MSWTVHEGATSMACLAAVLLAAASLVATTQNIASGTTDNLGLDRIDQPTLPLDGKFIYVGDGHGVKVFIIDDGVYKEHDEFKDRIIVVGNFGVSPTDPHPTEDDDVRDCALQNGWEGHGTHNASYAAGARYGVAKKAQIYVLATQPPIGYPNCSPGPGPSAVKAAVDWIVSHRDWTIGHTDHPEWDYSLPGVINISSGDAGDAGVQASILAAVDAGYTVTLSAANQADVGTVYGAAVSGKAIIAAVTALDDRAQRVDYGPSLTVYTPGVGTRSAAAPDLTVPDPLGLNPGRSHTPTTSGPQAECRGLNLACDSYAAPVAAGVAAAYLSLHPSATPAQVRQLLINKAVAAVVGLSGSHTPNRLLQLIDDAV